MTTRQRRGWAITAVMFLSVLFTMGAQNGVGIMVPSLLGYFGGSRAHISWIFSVQTGTSGALVIAAGWLLDRYPAQWVVAAGMVVAGCGYLLASQAHLFGTLLWAYFLLGIAGAFAGTVPATVLVTSWIPEHRAFALALALLGAAAGGAILTQVCGYMIRHWDWRLAYVALGVPAIVVMVPLVLMVIRNRGDETSGAKKSLNDESAPGLLVGEGLRGRSFWLIAFMYFTWSVYGAVILMHFPHSLIEFGYTPTQAALGISVLLGLGSVGKLIFSACADRFGTRGILTLALAALALQQALFIPRPGPLMVELYVALGFFLPVPYVLIPVLQVECFGHKRLGTLAAMGTVASMVGGTLGPLMAGRLFDLYGPYGAAYTIMFVMATIAALMPWACIPYTAAQAAESELAFSGAH